MKDNVISLNKYKEKKQRQNKLDMIRATDELIEMAHKKGICEYCGSFLDNPYHGDICPNNRKYI